MVNGNYILYGDRPSSESEIVEDHVHKRTVDRKTKRKVNRTAAELQRSLKTAQRDNETDSVKYEKKIKEPRLLRYVPTSDVEENFVTEKFETYGLHPTEERPRRPFTKKPKNPSDGSVNYAYSRSSSSSPTGNLPTISEHCEQYGTYRTRPVPTISVNDTISYESKLDKYFAKPRELKKFSAKGSHPDSLYRVPTSSAAGAGRLARVLRVLRWPVALIVVCGALATFVYFLMPANLESGLEAANSTDWEPSVISASSGAHSQILPEQSEPKPNSEKDLHTIDAGKPGTKTPEIDFYDADTGKDFERISLIETVTETTPTRKLPIPPVFPVHITPEVQYGNEKADINNMRSPKVFGESNTVPVDSTAKPHITQKPEKPLAIYFKDAANTEAITNAESINKVSTYGGKQTTKLIEELSAQVVPAVYKNPILQEGIFKHRYLSNPEIPPEVQEFYSRRPVNVDLNFTSGHSKFFGIGIEDAEQMSSTTQSSLYNTRVSPTLPTWRDGDDATTKNYPVNVNSDVPQCHSPRLAMCRGILPYDLASSPASIRGVEITSLLSQIEYLVATNCSDRVRHFACALLEPECNAPSYPPKKPCFSMCKSILDSCEGYLPRELIPLFNCKRYANQTCVAARAPCYARELPCGDGSCVPRDWMCNGARDCPAGEDEQVCVACEKHEYRCPSDMCIKEQWLCDGYADCPRGEDESESLCAGRGGGGGGEEAVEPRADFGETGAGSAPAPSVRRPNKLPELRYRTGESDSRELLMTSDSSNAFKRNFTRRPSPSRLTPYRPKLRQPPATESHSEEEGVEEQTRKPFSSRRYHRTTTTTTVNPAFNNRDSAEDINIGDLGFSEELMKDKKKEPVETNPSMTPSKPTKIDFNVDAQNPSLASITHIDKNKNSMDRVLNGAELMRKAVEAEDAEEALSNPPGGNIKEIDEMPSEGGAQSAGSAHASPCPSGELRCVDGRCITLAQLCDGTIDCTDHADEDNCYT